MEWYFGPLFVASMVFFIILAVNELRLEEPDVGDVVFEVAIGKEMHVFGFNVMAGSLMIIWILLAILGAIFEPVRQLLAVGVCISVLAFGVIWLIKTPARRKNKKIERIKESNELQKGIHDGFEREL